LTKVPSYLSPANSPALRPQMYVPSPSCEKDALS
jgi:hypothetical protein